MVSAKLDVQIRTFSTFRFRLRLFISRQIRNLPLRKVTKVRETEEDKINVLTFVICLSTPIITLEDVYVTGLLAKKCHMNHIRSLHFKHMGIEDLCRIDPFKDVIIHKVDISKMHQRITGQNVHESNTELLKPLCND